MERDTPLHLPDLHISGFRGIQSLDVNRLGRVTLIAGKNGVGKTTLLDAVRVYASRGNFNLIADILRAREELIALVDEDGKEAVTPDFESLIYGRSLSAEFPVAIGPKDVEKQLRITVQPTPHPIALFTDASLFIDDILIKSEFLGKTHEALASDITLRPRSVRLQEYQFNPAIRCEAVGPGVIDNYKMAKFWDGIALTDYEDKSVQAMRLIYGDEIERLAFVGLETRSSRSRLRAIVKTRSQKRPVPLLSLGDGAVRIFGVALALANSRDGFLLLDEAENGIHHSVQHAYWRMVLETAQKYNVQVLATTHSFDCVRGFAHAVEDSVIKGVLFRMEKYDDGHMRAVEYSDKALRVAANRGIEVR